VLVLKHRLKEHAILPGDAKLLFVTKIVRLFAYGALSVVLVLYLSDVGLNDSRIGLLLTLTLVGDTFISLFLTTRADRFGRRRTLVIGSLLMASAGAAFASTRSLFLLTIAGIIGVISPSGNEVGPFLSVEQAALSQVVSGKNRTSIFAWYTLAGSIATAVGSLVGGVLPHLFRMDGSGPASAYRPVVLLYGALGIVLGFLFSRLSSTVEDDSRPEHEAGVTTAKELLGIGHSKKIVLQLSTLFGLDAFAGGFVVQSFAAYWFHLRFCLDPATLGAIFFGANRLPLSSRRPVPPWNPESLSGVFGPISPMDRKRNS